MENKEDWEELNKWQENHEQNIKDQYKGEDITKFMKDNKEHAEKMRKRAKVGEKVVKVILWAYVIFLILFITAILLIYINYMKAIQDQTDIDVIANLEMLYDIKFKIISVNSKDKHNETLKITTTGEDTIEFTAIRNFGEYECDYIDQNLKYFYEKADSKIKQIFTPKESYLENGLLKYELYAKANSLEEIEKVVNEYLNLKNFANRYYTIAWNIRIKDGSYDEKITVLNRNEKTQKVINRAKCKYVIWHVNNNKNMPNVTEKEKDEYYKIDILQLIVNGQEVYTHFSDPPAIQHVMYDYIDNEYSVPIECLDIVKGVSMKKDETGHATEISYKGKTYKVYRNTLDLEKGVIPTAPNTETLEEIYGVEFKYDMKKKIMYLNMN